MLARNLAGVSSAQRYRDEIAFEYENEVQICFGLVVYSCQIVSRRPIDKAFSLLEDLYFVYERKEYKLFFFF